MGKKQIKLPHIFYTVTVLDKKKATGRVKEFIDKGFVACVESVDKNNSNIFIEMPIKAKHYGTIGHEIIHVLQHICVQRGIDFDREDEHMAYLWQYIFNQITGYEYE